MMSNTNAMFYKIPHCTVHHHNWIKRNLVTFYSWYDIIHVCGLASDVYVKFSSRIYQGQLALFMDEILAIYIKSVRERCVRVWYLLCICALYITMFILEQVIFKHSASHTNSSIVTWFIYATLISESQYVVWIFNDGVFNNGFQMT